MSARGRGVPRGALSCSVTGAGNQDLRLSSNGRSDVTLYGLCISVVGDNYIGSDSCLLSICFILNALDCSNLQLTVSPMMEIMVSDLFAVTVA